MVRAEDEDVEHKKLISFIFRFYSESISRFSTSRQSLARRFAYLLSNNVRNTTTRFLSPSFFSFFFRFFKAEEFRVFIQKVIP